MTEDEMVGSMEFSKQEYWSGLPSPSPEDLPNPGITPGSPALQILYCLSHQDSLIQQTNKIELHNLVLGIDLSFIDIILNKKEYS